jgi:hypothetical protein
MKFHVPNWPAYDAALRQRGSLTFWVEDDARPIEPPCLGAQLTLL